MRQLKRFAIISINFILKVNSIHFILNFSKVRQISIFQNTCTYLNKRILKQLNIKTLKNIKTTKYIIKTYSKFLRFY